MGASCHTAASAESWAVGGAAAAPGGGRQPWTDRYEANYETMDVPACFVQDANAVTKSAFAPRL